MRHFHLLLLLFISIPASSTELVPGSETLPAYSRHYSPERDPFEDGRNAIALAAKTDRRVLIELGGEWCTWCHVLDKFLAEHPEVNQQFHASFVLLKVNVSDDNKNQAFRKALPPTDGFPHFFVSDRNGKVIHSQDNLELLNDGQYSIEKFLGFVQQWGPDATGNNQP